MFNRETTIGVTTRLGTSLAMVLRKVHRLRLASQENLEIARHGPELMATLRADVSLLNVF